MRKILIVGAGHAGLHLAHGLLTHGYDVTVITGQSSPEIRTGKPSISQFTLPTALEYERAFDLDLWSALSPQIREQKLFLYRDGQEVTSLTGSSHTGNGYSLSVDRRVKMADWLEFFEDRGGKVVIHGVTVTDLDYFSRMFDLIIVAVGHGELGQLFDDDDSRFSGTRQRAIAQAYMYDVWPDPGENENLGWSAVTEEAGNIIFIPILSQEGPCHSLLMVDKKGGPMDAWPDRPGPEEQLRRMKDLLRKYAPDFFERIRDAVLIDGRSTLVEDLTPQVRNPVGRLPSGGRVLGMADVVVTMDPFVGQTWNNSTRCAQTYLESILDQGDQPFDEEFLLKTFDRFWEFGRDNQQWADFASSMWERDDLPEHVANVMIHASQYREVADRWIQGWDQPSDYKSWLFDPEAAQRYLADVKARNGG
ncbi:styrene monooxygenase/indole monooxygenase family protein [Nocardiopsis alba]|uniref:Styrene monooxygenase/indole monooxygenase family protein n=2 Tax=Nocardiopsis alba TaxID=53437 RepID=A0ABV5DTM6_9ACTN|nr:styrene monooxygenase/indole monooxygenase family protein [Nocardiopsis alba]AFR10503.1 pyridine nucleotide-disulfide oxidoreductase family protein [Nocardiopsis alba ATCC BAA-2165]